MRGSLRSSLALLLALALLGCGGQQTLYVGLTQTEANEMLSLMYASGLPGEKLVEKDGSYTVTTSKDAFPRSMALLQRHGLPREQFESMGKVFAREGFVSSPLEERARLNFALSQEMSRTISSIDGVVMARVHLVMPERERLVENRQSASASVFVKHRPDVDLSDQIGKIKSIIINGVENLPYDNVTVAFFEAQPLDALVPEGEDAADPPALAASLQGLGPASVLLSVLVGALALALATVLLLLAKRRQSGDGRAP